MFKHKSIASLAILFAVLFVGCASFTATKEILNDPEAQPKTFEDSLIVTQTQFAATRDVATLAFKTGLISNEIAVKIDLHTREFRDEVDLIKAAYSGVGTIEDCKIEYPPGSGVVVPCQDRNDQILAALILLQQVLEAK